MVAEIAAGVEGLVGAVPLLPAVLFPLCHGDRRCSSVARSEARSDDGRGRRHRFWVCR